MAWSYGNLRWQLPFESRKGVTCRVDIYKRGYTGSSVTQLIGTDKPVYWDEDSDESLLTTVRSKTGYLNLIEETYGDLNDIYPATDIDHYVEVYYGSTCVFSGFIKAQTFGLPFTPGPRILKLPIQSPLEVASGIKMTAVDMPTYKSLGTILKEACTKLQSNITQVIFPVGITLDTGYTADLTWKVISLAYCPYNSDFDNYKEHDQDVFITKDVQYCINGICNCFGLMVHDFPGMLVFSKVDYSGSYGIYNVSSLDGTTLTPIATIDSSVATDYNNIDILSDNGKETQIMPVKNIEINYEGDFEKTVEITYDFAKFWWWQQTTSEGKLITYKKFDPALQSQFWNNGIFPTNDLTPPPYGPDTKRGLWMAEFGLNGLNKKILYRPNTGATATLPVLLWYLWVVPPRGDSYKYAFTMTIEKGQGALNLNKAVGLNVNLRIQYNGMYWNGTDWTHTSSYVTATTDSEGKINCVVTIIYSMILAPERMTIEILAGDMASDAYIYAWSEIKFGYTILQEIFDKVIPEPLTSKEIIVENGSNEEDAVSQAFNLAINNFNHVSSPTDGREVVGMPTQYEYMFMSRTLLEIDTLLPRSGNIYVQNVKYIRDTPKRKIISCGFTPSEDEMNVTMQDINSLS